jgi:hypothetical protein
LDQAIARLHEKNIFKKGERELDVCSLLPESSWRPLKSPKWKGKEAYPIGADSNGNLYLRVCDGTVHLWNSETGQDEILSPSVREFISSLKSALSENFNEARKKIHDAGPLGTLNPLPNPRSSVSIRGSPLCPS